LKDFRKNIIDELDNLKENNPSKYCMPLDFLFFNENIPSIISLSVILKSSSEKICELDNLKENNPSKYWTLLNDLSRDNMTTSPDIFPMHYQL
jgi:anthranilate/para-aminobenzoate synthase component I